MQVIGLYSLHGERSEFIGGVIDALRAERYEVRLRNADGVTASDREPFSVVGSESNHEAVATCYGARGVPGETGYAAPIAHVALDPESDPAEAVLMILDALAAPAPAAATDHEPEGE